MSKTEGTTENAAPATTATVVAAMPEQNGVREPKPGTSCAAIWALATAMSTERKATVAVGDLLDKGVEQGLNPATIKTQYARWRKFHGVEGRVESDKSRLKREQREAEKAEKAKAKADAKAKREAEKAEKAKAKAEEKARKEQEKKEKAEAKAKEQAAKAEAKAKADADKAEAKAKAGAAKAK